MSHVKGNEINGDAAVSRHISVGGNALINGNVKCGKNLKVEGWLEAKNIKSVNKGLFVSIGSLRETYPLPHDGWFAGVSATEQDISDLGLSSTQGKALFRMYIGHGGDWVCEPVNKLYEIVVNQEEVDGLSESISAVESNISTLSGAISDVETQVMTIAESKGAAGGIAPLGSDGKVPEAYLPVTTATVDAAISEALAEEPRSLQQLWNEACSPAINVSISESVGCYNPETKKYELNGYTDISPTMAARILISWLRGGSCRCKTNLPARGDTTDEIQYADGAMVNSLCEKWVGAPKIIGGEVAGTDPGWVVNSTVKTMLNVNAFAGGDFKVGNSTLLTEIRFCRVTKDIIDLKGASTDLSTESVLSCLDAMIKYRDNSKVGEIKLPSTDCYFRCSLNDEVQSKCNLANVVLTCDELPPALEP